ncbi:hypothetical protein KC19_VG056200 [Ceratodon purpureus]|uniref:RPW8 domain-containing protein n=1 Tax=Ceratodon purpureus TaxID=3225 RepID=A0A8T0HMA8_CERPU|nr:hypothetical protein KC19_VG056200 [Ceratodon purpureus]
MVSGVVLGAVVGALLTEVIDKLREAYRCKGNCKKLESTLHSVKAHMEKIADRGSDTSRTWLEDLKGLLKKDEQIIDKYCIIKKQTLISSAFVY